MLSVHGEKFSRVSFYPKIRNQNQNNVSLENLKSPSNLNNAYETHLNYRKNTGLNLINYKEGSLILFQIHIEIYYILSLLIIIY